MKSQNADSAYWNFSVQQTEELLHSNAHQGLSSTEAASRLERHGANELTGKKKSGLLAKFISQFKSFMILILLAAALISGIAGYLEGEGVTDALIILAIVLVNACIGTAQETKAENALEALEKMSAPHCKVVRDRQIWTIEARELAPGDVVVIEAGDLVPADLRLAEAVNLKIQESALTGESLPEDKHTDKLDGDVLLGDRENMAFSSSIVTYGRGRGIVTSTGMQTEVGKIAAMLQAVPDSKTPMQVKLDQLGRVLGITAVVICALIFVVGFFQGREMLGMFLIAVSLAVAAIPEGLPAVSTVVLAVGMQRLAAKNAIVRNLPSVETLGSTTVICSDKTGTLTQNRMTVIKMFSDNKSSDIPQEADAGQKQLLLAGILANDGKLSSVPEGWKSTGDPTETALLELGLRLGLNKHELEERFARIAEIPFDSERKMMSTVNRNGSGGKPGGEPSGESGHEPSGGLGQKSDHEPGRESNLTLYIKGGPDEVLERCTSILLNGEVKPLDEAAKELIRQENLSMAGQALRVLATAFKPLNELPGVITSATLEQELIFCGLLGMMDPPREEVRAAVATCRSAGIRPVMITGDHMATALAVAASLGIKTAGETALTGADLEKMPESELDAQVGKTAVFARVAPEHKVRIVKALQNQGAVVAMTGDGVNDAPALKLADIGVAMGITGTDVSKEAADIVLTDDNFATIVTAVEEGRRIYDNILKAVQFLLSTNIGEILVIFIAILSDWATPLLPVQILWINLVTDSLPALALSVDPAESDIMERKPVDAKTGILQGGFLLRILLQGAMIAFFSLSAFLIGMKTDVPTAQTMAFAVLAFTQITHVLNVRSARHSAFKDMFSNKLLLGALAIVLSLMVMVLEIPSLHGIFHVVPLNSVQWLWVIGLSIAPLPLVEAIKLAVRILKK